MTTMNHDSLRKVVASIGVFLIAISLYCSFLLYTGFSTSIGDKAAWGGVGLGLDMFKNIALPAAFLLWGMGFFAARFVSGILGLAYIVLTLLSFSAFFGFMSGVQHDLEKEALVSSTRYAVAQSAVATATREVESLSKYADASVVEPAQAEIAKVEGKAQAIKQAMAAHANPDCSPKKDGHGNAYTSRAAEWCGQLRAVQAEAAPWQEKVEGHQRYKSALAHKEITLKDLAALGSGAATISELGLHPMFIDLGRLLNVDPRTAKVVFMFISSASAELLGTLSILIVMLLGRTKSFTLDEIEQMSSQLRSQQDRIQVALGMPLTAKTLAPPKQESPTEKIGYKRTPIMEEPLAAPAFAPSSESPITKKLVRRIPSTRILLKEFTSVRVASTEYVKGSLITITHGVKGGDPFDLPAPIAATFVGFVQYAEVPTAVIATTAVKKDGNWKASRAVVAAYLDETPDGCFLYLCVDASTGDLYIMG